MIVGRAILDVKIRWLHLIFIYLFITQEKTQKSLNKRKTQTKVTTYFYKKYLPADLNTNKIITITGLSAHNNKILIT